MMEPNPQVSDRAAISRLRVTPPATVAPPRTVTSVSRLRHATIHPQPFQSGIRPSLFPRRHCRRRRPPSSSQWWMPRRTPVVSPPPASAIPRPTPNTRSDSPDRNHRTTVTRESSAAHAWAVLDDVALEQTARASSPAIATSRGNDGDRARAVSLRPPTRRVCGLDRGSLPVRMGWRTKDTGG
jgi:hypothetical protein